MKILNMYLLRVVLVGFLLSTVASAQNSLWWQNISEGKGAPIVKFDDNTPEIATSGSIIHSLWLTWTGFATQTHELNYRRSADNGITWGPKIKLIEDYFDAERGSRRMAVSGNYVHIIVNENFGAERQVIYFRSSDGGASFEPPKVLYNTQFGSQLIHIDAEGSRVIISVEENKRLHMFKSDDNGSNFEKKLALGETFTATQYTSLKISGQNVFMICENQGRVHLLSSNDGGNTFNNKIISEPSKNGQHVTYPFINSNNSYCPKIAVDGNKIWIVWLGLDENDKLTVFVRHSPDGGVTLDTLKKVSGTITNIIFGLETIAAKGNNVYVVFTTTNNLLYINQSMNGGTTYIGVKEFTRPNSYYLNSSIEPQLIIDPKDNGAYIIGSGPIIGKLLPDGTEKIPSFYGNYNFNSSREPKMVLSLGGYLHILQRAGISGSDVNIWYRRINTNPIDPGNSDQVIKLNPVQSGDSARFDNMIIGPEISKKFSEAMTIEFWVKPSSLQNGEKKMLTQYRNGTGNLYNPWAFQLWATATNEPVAGLITSTGLYLLPAVKKLTADFWNHLAVSYKNDGSANNFKVFINGQIAAQKTATGTITFSDALWILGSFGGVNTGSPGFIGSVDDLRFWNVERSSDEIRNNRFSKLQGNELGLVANYRFDVISPFGEVADISGNSHTGYLMYKEELLKSDISDIEVEFTYIQNSMSIYFFAKPKDGDNYHWNFGDGNKTDQVNPKFTYSTPGIYSVCLNVLKGSNSGTFCEDITVYGLEKIVPGEGGNSGYISTYIYGGGLGSGSTVQLELDGVPTILAEKVYFDTTLPNLIQAVFNLNGKTKGRYNVVVKNGASTYHLEKAFSVQAGRASEPFVSISGPKNIGINRWATYSITVGNNSNVDAYGVPVWLAFTGDVEISFVGLQVTVPEEIIDLGWGSLIDSIKLINEFDTLFGKAQKGKLVSLYFKVLPANFSKTFSVRIKSLTAKPNQIIVWNTPALFASPLNDFAKQCMYEVLVYTVLKSGIEVFIPGTGCVFGGLEFLLQFKDDIPPPPGGNTQAENFLMHLSTAAAECLTTWNPISNLGSGLIFTGSVSAELYYSYNDCKYGFRPLNLFTFFYYVLYSFDPNEKNGISGYGSENHIGPLNSVTYQINFENKPTATAPAQEVVITDTINTNFFDWGTFSFGSVGFGDKIFYPNTGVYEFGMDIDLRPEKNYIVRITGKADTITGVITWHYSTLIPESLQFPEDALAGFLPPNIISPEGEGFVNFTIGLRNNPVHNQPFSNQANITFDSNPVILTNSFKNTFDLIAPESNLVSLSNTSKDTTLMLEIAGIDEGCGIREFEIFVSKNGGSYNFAGTAFSKNYTFNGKIGNTYAFYSIAIDSVGNRETAPAVPDAVVLITSSTQDNYILEKLIVYPSPSSFELFVEFYLPFEEFIDISMSDISGRELIRHDQIKCNSGLNLKNLDITSLPDGFYNLSLKVGNRKVYKKVVVIK